MFSIFDGPDAQCVLLSIRPALVHALGQVLEQNEATMEHVKDYTALADALETIPDLNYILIDLDAHEGVNAQFPFLRHIRDSFPGKHMILLSEDFQTDEFGTHRLTLGDISLRVPVLHASLELALLQAPVNNLQWRARQAEQPPRTAAVSAG
ncbi:hypothetical protein [Roseovarius sp. SYSU LYC5161]|jgi:hypothetical protein|uniref:hypothetical protein n=1 Tax=Roseovarius halophilus (ex Wu et al. 2025) TaxID=3376060 RepID=UPI002870E2FD|nr:hypothetical protein [Roseovarius sp.]